MTTILITIAVTMLGSAGFWGFLQHLLESRKEKQGKSIHDVLVKLDNVATKQEIQDLRAEMSELRAKQEHLSEELSATKDLALSSSRDRINHLCNKYMENGYIPSDEIDAFLLLGNSYIDAKGNSVVLDKFKRAKELPIVSPNK